MWPEASRQTSATEPAEVFSHGSYESEVSRVSGGVRPRGAVRLRPLLRAARGRLRPRRPRRRPRPAPPPHPGRPAEHLALRGLPAARQPAGPVRARVVAQRTAGRLYAADPRRPARRAPRPAGGLGQERRREPDPLLQGPRRVRRLDARARAWLRGP